MESENINFDEHVEVQDNESTKKTKEYKSFVYLYEGMPNEGDVANQNENQ